MFTVYMIYNLVNGKGYAGYTSKTAAQRFNKHIEMARCGSRYYLHRAMRKYGTRMFDVIALSHCGRHDEALQQERDLIAAFDLTHCGYNLTGGGEGMYAPSEETRRKLSAWQKGKPKTLEHRRKLSDAKKGKRPSEKQMLALRNSGGHTGHHHSEETRRKISNAKLISNARKREHGGQQSISFIG